VSERKPPRPKTPRGIEARLRRGPEGWVWRYRVRWQDSLSGRRSVEELDTLDDALDFQAELRLARRRGALGDLDRGNERVADFVAEWWERYAKPNLSSATRKLYASMWNKHALPRIGHLELRQVTPGVIARLRHDLEEEGVGNEAIRKTMSMLQSVFRDAIVWERLPASSWNPVQPVRKPQKKRQLAIVVFAPPAVESLRAGMTPESAALISLMAYEGLRPEEALALEVRHIRERTLLIEQKNVDGEILTGQKTNKPPRAPDLWVPVRDELLDLVGERRGGLVFARTDGRAWTNTDYRNWRKRVFQPAAAAAGLGELERVITYETTNGVRRRRTRSRYKGPRPYDLRHTCASLLLRDPNFTLIEIAQFLGHDVATLSTHYAHVIAELKGQPPIPVEQAIREARQNPLRKATPPERPSRRIRPNDDHFRAKKKPLFPAPL
jgi:integrase